MDAFHTETNQHLKEQVIEHFNWMKAAEQTIKAYEKILSVKKKCRKEHTDERKSIYSNAKN